MKRGQEDRKFKRKGCEIFMAIFSIYMKAIRAGTFEKWKPLKALTILLLPPCFSLSTPKNRNPIDMVSYGQKNLEIEGHWPTGRAP